MQLEQMMDEMTQQVQEHNDTQNAATEYALLYRCASIDAEQVNSFSQGHRKRPRTELAASVLPAAISRELANADEAKAQSEHLHGQLQATRTQVWSRLSGFLIFYTITSATMVVS